VSLRYRRKNGGGEVLAWSMKGILHCQEVQGCLRFGDPSFGIADTDSRLKSRSRASVPIAGWRFCHFVKKVLKRTYFAIADLGEVVLCGSLAR
jgi:hypothetical protein